MQLVVTPADQNFLSNLRAPNVLIARKRRRTAIRFLTHAAGVGAVLAASVVYLDSAAARSPKLATIGHGVAAQTVAATPVDAKGVRVLPL